MPICCALQLQKREMSLNCFVKESHRWFMRLLGDDTGFWRDSCQKWNTTICSKRSSNWYLGSWGRQHGNSLRQPLGSVPALPLILSINTRVSKEDRWESPSQSQSRNPPLLVLRGQMRKAKIAEDTIPCFVNSFGRGKEDPRLRTGDPCLDRAWVVCGEYKGDWTQQYQVPINASVLCSPYLT